MFWAQTDMSLIKTEYWKCVILGCAIFFVCLGGGFTRKMGKKCIITRSDDWHKCPKKTDRTICAISIFWWQFHIQWVNSNQGCMWSAWRGLEPSSWAFQLDSETAGWLLRSFISSHRQKLGTLYPWPVFSISSDNVLLTPSFSCKKSL